MIVKVKFLSLLYFSATVWKTGLQMKPRTQLLGDWREFVPCKEANSSLHEHQTQTQSQPGERASRKGRAPAWWLRLSLNHSLPIMGFLVNCKLQELGLVYHKRNRWGLRQCALVWCKLAQYQPPLPRKHICPCWSRRVTLALDLIHKWFLRASAWTVVTLRWGPGCILCSED